MYVGFYIETIFIVGYSLLICKSSLKSSLVLFLVLICFSNIAFLLGLKLCLLNCRWLPNADLSGLDKCSLILTCKGRKVLPIFFLKIMHNANDYLCVLYQVRTECQDITGHIAMSDKMVQNKQKIAVQHGFYTQSFPRERMLKFPYFSTKYSVMGVPFKPNSFRTPRTKVQTHDSMHGKHGKPYIDGK